MAREGVRYRISSDFDNRGVKAAEKGIVALGKSALKATVGITSASVAVAKLNQFLQQSVQAALADQKAQAALTKTLENSGFGMASRDVADFINQMQLATGVSEDQLRPAFTALFNAVGSVTEAQRLLNIALDVSVATGRDVTAVTAALGKAAIGSNTAIQRLGLGISKTELATKSFDEVVTLLANKFTGTAARAADTMGGKFDRLKIAVGEAKEEIGTGLLDALQILGRDGGQSIDQLNEKIIRLGTTVGDFARGLGVVGARLREIGNIPVGESSLMGFLFKTLPGGSLYMKLGEFITGLGEAERAAQNIGLGGSYFSRQAGLRLEQQAKRQQQLETQRRRLDELSKKRAAAADAARKRAAEAQEKKRKELEKQINEVAKQFDIERISIAAALARQQDASTQARLQALMKLNDMQYMELDTLEKMDDELEKLKELQDKLTGSATSTAVAVQKIYEAYKLTSGEAKRLSDIYTTSMVANQAPTAAAFRAAESLASGGIALSGGPITAGSGAATIPTTTTPTVAPVTVNINALSTMDIEEAVAAAVNSGSRAGLAYTQVFSRL